MDEADNLLDMGFRPQIDRIIRRLPGKQNRQTLLFSATFPQSVQQLTGVALKPQFATVDCVGTEVSTNHQASAAASAAADPLRRRRRCGRWAGAQSCGLLRTRAGWQHAFPLAPPPPPHTPIPSRHTANPTPPLPPSPHPLPAGVPAAAAALTGGPPRAAVWAAEAPHGRGPRFQGHLLLPHRAHHGCGPALCILLLGALGGTGGPLRAQLSHGRAGRGSAAGPGKGAAAAAASSRCALATTLPPRARLQASSASSSRRWACRCWRCTAARARATGTRWRRPSGAAPARSCSART
jgi:hypothetical protein